MSRLIIQWLTENVKKKVRRGPNTFVRQAMHFYYACVCNPDMHEG